MNGVNHGAQLALHFFKVKFYFVLPSNWDAELLYTAFVSIQGLVLVKEPYFCEPSFERMRGTAEGTLNSRLYKYVPPRSRHFPHLLADKTRAVNELT